MTTLRVCRARPLPIHKALDIRELSDLWFSLDGKRVAFTVLEPPTTENGSSPVFRAGLALRRPDLLIPNAVS